MNLNRLLTTVVSLLFIFKISAFETSIDPDHLSARTYKDSPQKSFALNDKNMQIKTPETSLVAAWVGHNISVSSENSISFKAKALKNENILFNCKVQMLTYHTSPAEKCNGSARSKFFIFGNYAEKEWKEFYFPLKIRQNVESRNIYFLFFHRGKGRNRIHTFQSENGISCKSAEKIR